MMIMMMMMIIIIIIHGGKRMAYICPIFWFQKSSSTGSLKKHMNTHLKLNCNKSNNIFQIWSLLDNMNITLSQ